MDKITRHKLEALSLGATILGSGGGGDPKILHDFIAYFMEMYGDINMLALADLRKDDLVVPIAFVGAPLVNTERLPNALIFDVIYEQIKLDFPTKNIVLMPAEIGGCNALTPLLMALKYNLPVLDADLIGRAFPKINMCKPAVLNAPCKHTYLADHLGNLISMHLTNFTLLETIVRDIVIHFGSSAGIATFLFDGENAHKYVIAGSLSRAIQLGHALLAKNTGTCMAEQTYIGSGMITDVFHNMQGGFLFGYVEIKNACSAFKVHYQNEYMKVSENEQDITGSPDIISIFDQKTRLPLTTEALTYGLDVAIYTLSPPDFWLQPEAYSLVDYKLLEL